MTFLKLDFSDPNTSPKYLFRIQVLCVYMKLILLLN